MADYLGLGELEQSKEDPWAPLPPHPTLDVWDDNTSSDLSLRRQESIDLPNSSRFSPPPRLQPSSPFDEEDYINEQEEGNIPPVPVLIDDDNDHEMSFTASHVPDPIRLRGVGNTTLFGLNSKFDDEFPSYLVGKVAPEEFQATMARINSVLYKSIPFNLKCLLCGCLCCCCTLGMSLGPVLYLSKRTQSRIGKIITQENWRLYNKLGLNIKLHKEQCDGTNLREYVSHRKKVLHVEFLPKQPLYHPE